MAWLLLVRALLPQGDTRVVERKLPREVAPAASSHLRGYVAARLHEARTIQGLDDSNVLREEGRASIERHVEVKIALMAVRWWRRVLV